MISIPWLIRQGSSFYPISSYRIKAKYKRGSAHISHQEVQVKTSPWRKCLEMCAGPRREAKIQRLLFLSQGRLQRSRALRPITAFILNKGATKKTAFISIQVKGLLLTTSSQRMFHLSKWLTRRR
jgi:hypothetical protein